MRPGLILRSATTVAIAAAVYLVVAALMGVVTGDGPAAPVAALTATAAVAGVYPALRTRVRRAWTDRFGPATADRYELLAGIQASVADVGDGPEALASVEQALSASTGSRQAHVELPLGTGAPIRPGRGAVADGGAPLRIVETPEGQEDEAGWLRWTLMAGGRQVGSIGLQGPAVDPGVAAELVHAVLPTVTRLWLEARLRDRAVALVSARQQLVAEHDRRMVELERHLHDVVQQELLAVGVKLGLAAAVAGPEATRLVDGLGSAAARARDATAAVRAVSRGVHPPILAARGLGPALASTARDTGIPLTVTSGATVRLPTPIESALFATGRAALASNPGGLAVSIAVEGPHAEVVLRATAGPVHLDDVLVRDRVGAVGGTVHRGGHALRLRVPTTARTGGARVGP